MSELQDNSNQYTPNQLEVIYNDKNQIRYWMNLFIIGDFLIIKDEPLQVFKLDYRTNQAFFLHETLLEEELIKIIELDKSSVFLFFSSSIKVYNFVNNSIKEIEFFLNQETLSSDKIVSIYFKSNSDYSNNNNDLGFGLFAVDNGKYYISRNIYNADSKLDIILELIGQFSEAVQNFECKVFYSNENKSNENNKSLFISAISKNRIYYTIIAKLDEEYSHILNALKISWKVLHENPNERIQNYTFHYDPELGFPISYIIISDNFNVSYRKLQRDEQNYLKVQYENELNLIKEIKSFNNLIKQNETIVGIHHFDNILYLFFNQKVFIYNFSTRELIYEKKFSTIKHMYFNQLIGKEEYSLHFLTNTNLYFFTIKTRLKRDKFKDQNFNIKKTRSIDPYSSDADFEKLVRKFFYLKYKIVYSLFIIVLPSQFLIIES
jgi:hypothetical protein